LEETEVQAEHPVFLLLALHFVAAVAAALLLEPLRALAAQVAAEMEERLQVRLVE